MEKARINTHPEKILCAAIFFLALLIRLIHNGYIMKNPLYYLPLGGHVPYLIMAEKIAQGDLLPINAPFSLSSPLYPYILGGIFSFADADRLFLVRLFSMILDSITCIMAAILARRHFGMLAFAACGAATALYGPLIFYSTELVSVSWTLFFTTLAILLLDRDKNGWSYLLSGVLLGAAIGTRPNLVILAVLIMPAPLLLKREKRWLKLSAFILGISLAILPITVANYRASGKFVLLTTSGGHNFYLGHNPDSRAGYSLPQQLDGDIFGNMKKLAEKVEDREFADDEVSSYYLKRALSHIYRHPFREIRIMGEKAAAAINDYEATNYTSYYFQEGLSPILSHAIGFGTLFPFAAVGLILYYRRYLLSVPIFATFLTILLFFYISRLRMPMIPFLAILAAGALSNMASCLRVPRWRKGIIYTVTLVFIYLCSNLKLVKIDTSNEWNKVGVILRIQKRYEEAERTFLRAIKENPTNMNTYLNLAVLYDTIGKQDRARWARAFAEKYRNTREEERFIRALKGG